MHSVCSRARKVYHTPSGPQRHRLLREAGQAWCLEPQPLERALCWFPTNGSLYLSGEQWEEADFWAWPGASGLFHWCPSPCSSCRQPDCSSLGG